MSIFGLTSSDLFLDGPVWLVLFLVLVFVILLGAALALRAIMVPVGDGTQAPLLGPWVGGAFLTFLGFVMFLAFGRGLQDWFQGMVG